MPLCLLAVYAVVRSVCVPVFQVQNVTRDVRYGMWQSLVLLVVLPPAFWYSGSCWGSPGIAAVWACLYPLLTAPVVYRILAKLEMPVQAYLAALRPAACASLVMAAVVLVVRRSMFGTDALVDLAVESLTGTLTYVGVLLLFFKPRLHVFLRFLRGGERS